VLYPEPEEEILPTWDAPAKPSGKPKLPPPPAASRKAKNGLALF
jgi:hypothetical protein